MMTLKRLVSAAAATLLLLLHQADDVTSFSLPAASLTSSKRTHHHHHPAIANPTKSTSSSLQAINLPSWTYYSLAHVIGGTTGTPIVISGTKKGSWFDRIPKPSINPPNFVFGPVWTILYSLMGVSVSRIVKSTSSTSSSMVLKLWYIHYALNLIWAPIFFGYQKFRLGLIISILLVVSLGLIMPLYHAIDPISAYLQVPYLCWLIFATVLNYQFCKLNPMDESDGKNEAMRQAELCKDGKAVYNDVMLQNDLRGLQKDAARYAGL